MRTTLSRAIVIAAAAVTIGTMSTLPAAADWRGNYPGYSATDRDHWFARRDREEGRHHHWMVWRFPFDRR